MSSRRISNFRYDASGRRAGAGNRPAAGREGGDRRAARAARRGRDRGRLRGLFARRLRGGAGRRASGEARHRCLAVPRELHGHRRRGGRARGRAALTDPHLPRHQRPPHGEEASPDARRGRRPRDVLGHPGLRERGRGRVLVRGRNAIRSRVRRHRLPCCRRSRRDHDQPPRHRRLHAAGRVRELHPVRTPALSRSSSRLRSRPTATTTSGSRSPTRWQRSTPACSSSSAR